MAKPTKAAMRKRLIEASNKLRLVMWKPWSGSREVSNALWKDLTDAEKALKRAISKMK